MRNNIKVIDAHLHFGTDPVISDSLTVPYLLYDDPDSVIRCLDHYGIEQTVLLTPDRILNPPFDVDYKKANDAVARAVHKYPDRIFGAIRINPNFGEEFVWDTVRHYVETYNFRGIKTLARVDFYNPSNLKVVEPMMRAAAHYDIPILFHSGHPSRDLPSLQAYAAKNFPETRIIIAHIGLHDYVNETIIACMELDNIFVDMSQAWPYDIKAFIKKIGCDRIMYGSDGPFQSPLVEMVKVEECDLTTEQLEKIFHKNAEEIWNIK